MKDLSSYTSSTFTHNKPKWSENRIEETIMRFVRYASSDSDALYNLRIELEQYKKSIKFWELIKLIFNK